MVDQSKYMVELDHPHIHKRKQKIQKHLKLVTEEQTLYQKLVAQLN